jgi:hypothetical protein
MVSREDEENGVGIPGKCVQSPQDDGGRRIPSHRFQKDGSRLDVHGPELLCNKETMMIVADDNGTVDSIESGKTQNGVLKQGAGAYKGEELFRVELP